MALIERFQGLTVASALTRTVAGESFESEEAVAARPTSPKNEKPRTKTAPHARLIAPSHPHGIRSPRSRGILPNAGADCDNAAPEPGPKMASERPRSAYPAAMMKSAVALTQIETPIGVVRLAASPDGLTHVKTRGAAALRERAGHGRCEARTHVLAAGTALTEYFEGRRRDFDHLQLAATGTPYQLSVWKALSEIPFGETESYGRLAESIGQAGGARAVGLANHLNPIGIIVPCHRVIGADGSMTGYAGGLELKRWLLGHEGALSMPLFP